MTERKWRKYETLKPVDPALPDPREALWEAYQFIGASLVQEHPEQDVVDMLDKLSKAMGVQDEPN